ncbi:MAG: four helix bundle protein [Mariprofundaceae bacterium]|nr:four helix bundle protein [Mariprofundaceae bacterium]
MSAEERELSSEERGNVRCFKDLVAWQKSRELNREIYTLTGKGAFANDFGLRDQIRRASVSISSNIAEGFDRSSRAEFHRFVVIAKASCAEVQSQLYLALDVGYLAHKEFEALMDRAKEVARILGGLRKSLKSEGKNE